jgi:hypothetical protein
MEFGHSKSKRNGSLDILWKLFLKKYDNSNEGSGRVGIGLLTSEFGFEVHIAGKVMSIFTTRSGERTAITINGKYLFKLPLIRVRPW